MEPSTTYIVYDDGTTERHVSQDGSAPILARPGRIVAEEEFTAAREALVAQHDALRDGLLRTEAAAMKSDYEEMIALGVTPAAARRMSGYYGE